MSFYSKRQVQEMVLYSDQHLGRLEKAGKFPKRVKIGPNRTGYVKKEIDDHIQQTDRASKKRLIVLLNAGVRAARNQLPGCLIFMPRLVATSVSGGKRLFIRIETRS